ncbi:tumor necrosis factor receptor superfamily member 5 [Paralichthys olivaceus]|uniref:tumor necrosis factor receptor superfamily member 5 n=1 Tax=Paralichthys olivaceus TaxID=8255 RepID=UPI00097D926A|nr:PREDICTED: tumor necrosis factor receptor superfamily member 5-like [Paralichthys olivaceus]
MNCSSEDKYLKGVRCCDRCSAGTYVQADCDGTRVTQCDKCRHGFYTATKNHLTKCHPCKECSSKNNQRKSKNCSASEDTECECETGFYCSNDQCDHCQPVTQCPAGEGVQVLANRTSDTICAPCEEGTYSNVTDFISRCKTHTRCADLGRELTIQGTKTTNSICGDGLPRCSWMLPAGLWSGLVLTALVLLAVVVWRAKRRAVKVRSSVPVTAEVVPVALVTLPDQSLPSTEPNGYCQESCAMEECKLTLISPDDDLVSCDMDISLPITPLKVSVSFAESSHNTAAAGYRTSNLHRSHSEPQEDEWCGT